MAEAGGEAILVGSGTEGAVETFEGIAQRLSLWETSGFRPTAWSSHLGPLVAPHDVVIVPASRDGRDLAPRLAVVLGRPLVASVVEVGESRIVATRFDGRLADVYARSVPVVVAFEPGSRGVIRDPGVSPSLDRSSFNLPQTGDDPVFVAAVRPDPRSVHLAEAARVVSAGAGVGDEHGIELVERLAASLGAGLGGTRVVVDRGWLPLERQIGTTGVMIDPDLYLAFGVSGAIQHLSGIGDPRRVIAVNTDPACPMMRRADVAVVGDARAVLTGLLSMLEP